MEKVEKEVIGDRFLIHMFNEIRNLISRVFGHWARIDINSDYASHSAVWIKGNCKFTFTAEIVKETHDDYPKDQDFITDHERIDEQNGIISTRNQVINNLREF